ncbi:MAG: hypothetical protein H6581_09240 [Bacteroidia bacterium]|nr:hypothetical protein [Bacteroidia bacterium]
MSKLSAVKGDLAKLDRHKLELSRPGVFILYKSNLGPPHYVGRDEVSMYLGMGEFRNNPDYKYYKFLPCKTGDDAYKWECIYWHTGQNTLDNSAERGGKHPKRPAGSTVKCPFPGCTADHDLDIEITAVVLDDPSEGSSEE